MMNTDSYESLSGDDDVGSDKPGGPTKPRGSRPSVNLSKRTQQGIPQAKPAVAAAIRSIRRSDQSPSPKPPSTAVRSPAETASPPAGRQTQAKTRRSTEALTALEPQGGRPTPNTSPEPPTQSAPAQSGSSPTASAGQTLDTAAFMAQVQAGADATIERVGGAPNATPTSPLVLPPEQTRQQLTNDVSDTGSLAEPIAHTHESTPPPDPTDWEPSQSGSTHPQVFFPAQTDPHHLLEAEFEAPDTDEHPKTPEPFDSVRATEPVGTPLHGSESPDGSPEGDSLIFAALEPMTHQTEIQAQVRPLAPSEIPGASPDGPASASVDPMAHDPESEAQTLPFGGSEIPDASPEGDRLGSADLDRVTHDPQTHTRARPAGGDGAVGIHGEDARDGQVDEAAGDQTDFDVFQPSSTPGPSPFAPNRAPPVAIPMVDAPARSSPAVDAVPTHKVVAPRASSASADASADAPQDSEALSLQIEAALDELKSLRRRGRHRLTLALVVLAIALIGAVGAFVHFNQTAVDHLEQRTETWTRLLEDLGSEHWPTRRMAALAIPKLAVWEQPWLAEPHIATLRQPRTRPFRARSVQALVSTLEELSHRLSAMLKASPDQALDEQLDGDIRLLSRVVINALQTCDSRGIDLGGARLTQLNLRELNLRGARLPSVVFARSDLRGADLADAIVDAGDLTGVDLRGAELVGTSLESAVLMNADLSDANLEGANLHDASLQQAVLIGANLAKAGLAVAKMRRANLSGARLEEANLKHAHLQRANLQMAKLGGANLESAQLQGANLGDADLTGADLTGANLAGADLKGATLTDAKLEGIKFDSSTQWPAGFTPR